MNIAAVTITYNDDYKFNEWVEHYKAYKDELYLHIIVDNNSISEYRKKLVNSFSDSVILRRNSNGGCTYAYNDGIKYALEEENVDAIMLIGNDIKFPTGELTKLYEFLCSDLEMGMVAPILLAKDSNVVDDFGCNISSKLEMEPLNSNCEISTITDETHYVEAVTGGMNLAKREFYEVVGLQDAKIFMYSDEVDMGIRAAKKGFKLAVTKNSKAWHQHINANNSNIRNSYTSYLIARNKVYLARKHFGLLKSIYLFLNYTCLSLGGLIVNILKPEIREHKFYLGLGALYGLIGNMKLSHIIKDFNDEDS